MRRAAVLVAMLAVAGCGGSEPGQNPPQLWITLNMSELRLRLTPVEPIPF